MLKCKRITEREADLYGPPPPPGVSQRNWKRTSVGPAVAWHRGKHTGRIDAILTLQEMGYTRAAERLQKHYGLNDEGSIVL